MTSVSDLIQSVGDLVATKSYSVAAFTILFYDHLLTLADEIKYVWSGKKSWGFWLFITNRYFPMTYQFWIFATTFGPYSNNKLCEKTSWCPLFTVVVCTLIAQVALTLRIYAVTLKNIPIVAGFAVITVCQFVVGMWVVILATLEGAGAIPQIPSDLFHECRFARHRALEITLISVALLYDSLTFSLIIFLAARSNRQMAGIRFKIPSILQTIAADATRYFLVIFTSHLVIMIILLHGRETIQLIPAPGNVVLLPVMVSRLMLSLKKAVDPQQDERSFSIHLTTIQFARSRTDTNVGISLGTHPGSQAATR